MNRGLFITIEGGDGSGKDTQIDLLVRHFERVGQPIVVTREPGGTAISEKIREIILDKDHKEMHARTEALLYAASRAQHVEEFIIPKVDDGNIVICSRFVDSSVVYQGVARDLGVDEVEALSNFATGFYNPDLTIYLDLDPEIGLRRKKNQQEMDRLEAESLEFHQMVREGYLELFGDNPDRIIRIDASESINEVHKQILDAISLAVPGRLGLDSRWECTEKGHEHEGKIGSLIAESLIEGFVVIRYDDGRLGIYSPLGLREIHREWRSW